MEPFLVPAAVVLSMLACAVLQEMGASVESPQEDQSGGSTAPDTTSEETVETGQSVVGTPPDN